MTTQPPSHSRRILYATILGIAFAIGFADIQLFSWWNANEFAIPGGIIVGAFYALAWGLMLPLFIGRRKWQMALVGMAFPVIACFLSVFGVGLLAYVVVGWFIFLPSGMLLGIATHILLREGVARYR